MKYVLFDVDGVLINSEVFSLKYQREFNVSNDVMLPFFLGEFQDCTIGKSDLREVIQPYLTKWNWEKSVDEFLQYWFESEHSIDERLLKTVADLSGQGIKCYLATNQEKYRLEYIRNNMGFDKIFDGMFVSCEIGMKKNNPQFFDYIVKALGANPEEIFFIDDDERNIKTAQSVGITGHVYSSYEAFQEKLKSVT